MLCGSLDGRGVWGRMDTCLCTAGSLCCSPETNTTLYINSVQLLSHIRLFATPWTAACQASLSITNSRRLLKLVSIESVMPSNHFILCHPLLLPHSNFPSIRVFSNKSLLHIGWPKYWNFSISPSNEYQDWFPLGCTGLISLQLKGLSRIIYSTTVQKHHFFGTQPSRPTLISVLAISSLAGVK